MDPTRTTRPSAQTSVASSGGMTTVPWGPTADQAKALFTYSVTIDDRRDRRERLAEGNPPREPPSAVWRAQDLPSYISLPLMLTLGDNEVLAEFAVTLVSSAVTFPEPEGWSRSRTR